MHATHTHTHTTYTHTLQLQAAQVFKGAIGEIMRPAGSAATSSSDPICVLLELHFLISSEVY